MTPLTRLLLPVVAVLRLTTRRGRGARRGGETGRGILTSAELTALVPATDAESEARREAIAAGLGEHYH